MHGGRRLRAGQVQFQNGFQNLADVYLAGDVGLEPTLSYLFDCAPFSWLSSR